MPDYGIGVVAFANRTYAGVGGVNMQVLDTIVKMAGLKPRQFPPSRILEQRKKELVKLLPEWNNAEQSGIFAENFFPDYPIDTLKNMQATFMQKREDYFSKRNESRKINCVDHLFLKERKQISRSILPYRPKIRH